MNYLNADRWNRVKIYFFLGLTFLFAQTAIAQDHITITGKILDAKTGQPLPFATVIYTGDATVGTTTDFDGLYTLESKWGTDSIQASFVGYRSETVAINLTLAKQELNFRLSEEGITLAMAEVTAQKHKYSKKDNPAVELIRKVIDSKAKNRIQSQDFFEYDKYEKMELALNNITDQFREKKSLKNFQFLFENMDTSKLNGKPFLPIYLREAASKVYYRKNPAQEKEYRSGVKVTEFDQWVSTDNMSLLTDRLYQKIDIYDDNIFMLSKIFISPISSSAGVAFYRYYIMDTIQYNGMEVIDLAFMPADKQAIGFKGDLYILNDSTNAVVKAEIGITAEANINWVNDLLLVQEFEHRDSFWTLSKDEIVMDFALNKKSNGLFGKRTVMYNNFIFNKPEDNSIYTGSTDVVETNDAYLKGDAFWATARQQPLSKQEAGIYVMADSIKQVPTFKRAMNVLSLVVSGYWKFDKMDMGPVGAFYSFNDVEGFRLRFGGNTTAQFSKKVQLAGYAAYGFRDQKFKFAGSILYSLRQLNDYHKFPKHNVKLSYQHETNFVGQNLEFVTEDNFLLSFKRGNASKLLFIDSYTAEYFRETRENISYSLGFMNQKQSPLGSLKFNYFSSGNPENIASLNSLTISEFQTSLRWAPNQQFVEGHNYRKPIFNRSPIFTLKYNYGIKGLLGGEYQYHKLYVDAFKRFFLPIVGMTDVTLEGGKVFSGGMPYYLLFIPRGNQTYSYQNRAYNLMNYLEFTSDTYVGWHVQHYFNGFIFNKVPLLKKLKLREVITFKGMWGSLSDKNNPTINKSLIQFIENSAGQVETLTFTNQPYMEASVGVSNIFKIGRIDFVKRLNYLDAPNVPVLFGSKGLGIRIKLGFEF